MRAPRFSIGSLLTVIGILGVGMAALRRPAPVWASVIYTVAVTAIVAGACNAIVGRGARRAYWIGFALFGGAYIYLTGGSELVTEPLLDLAYPYVAPAPSGTPPNAITSPPSAIPSSPNGPSLPISVDAGSPVQGPDAVTTAWTAVVAPTATTVPASFSPAAAPPDAASAWDHWTKPDLRLDEIVPPREWSAKFSSLSFRQIGHALAGMLVATLGGVFVQWRYEENCREDHRPEVTS
jgi:hypothetical protein